MDRESIDYISSKVLSCETVMVIKRCLELKFNLPELAFDSKTLNNIETYIKKASLYLSNSRIFLTL